MALEKYRAKRDFEKTPEPAGKAARSGGRRFVIQKHAARRLHYDFRLELDGVLLSWAVPKGPSLDPSEKRLAVRVEDHPIEYGDFEGVIPKGQYGGGTVLLWDRGTWEPEGDPRKDLRKGRLSFELHGEKLQGGWSLVRMGRQDGDKVNWLLIKKSDEWARPLSEGDILVERSESVKTGRTIAEIAANRDAVWHSHRAASEAEERTAAATDPSTIPGARKRKMPDWVEPQLATRVPSAPEGDSWFHEIKLDGYRLLGRLDKGRVTLLTRKGLDWTAKFPGVARALPALPAERAVVDGEAVVMVEDGTTSFQALQESLSQEVEGLSYFAFDLLYLDGYDLTGASLEDRKAALAALFRRFPEGGPVRYSDHIAGKGAEFFATACQHRLEGIISKRRDRPYRPGRGKDWVKVKCVQRQEFVIGGWTEPSGSRVGIGALLAGYHEKPGAPLRYAGKVGTGFDTETLMELAERLAPLERKTSPFDDPVPRADAKRAHWVSPKLVAEIEFAEWTRDGRLRHPSFKGLREDKPAREVERESEAPTPDGDEPRPKRAAKRKVSRVVKKGRSAKKAREKKASAKAPTLELSGVRISNPDRVLWPDEGATKGELARYYADVAERMLPHVTGRPLTLIRCPRGTDKECFYQKHADDSFPPAVKRVWVTEERGEEKPYVAIEDAQGLLSLVQFGVLEIHPWGSRSDDLERPDHVLFDLDPDPAVPWKGVVQAARDLRRRLASLGLEPLVKSTGGKGLHVDVPLVPEHDWDAVKAFAQAVATAMASEEPARFVATASKARRRGKIYVDWLRNGRGATAVAPYSARARKGAPVAAPLRWEELGRLKRPDTYTIANLRRRLGSLSADPWEGYDAARASLTPAIEELVGRVEGARRSRRQGSDGAKRRSRRT